MNRHPKEKKIFFECNLLDWPRVLTVSPSR